MWRNLSSSMIKSFEFNVRNPDVRINFLQSSPQLDLRAIGEVMREEGKVDPPSVEIRNFADEKESIDERKRGRCRSICQENLGVFEHP